MADPRARYIADHAATLLLVQAVRAPTADRLDLDAAIRTAGALYDRLAAARRVAGTDRAAEPEPRVGVDYVGALASDQRAGFEGFFRAYWQGGKPVGKQRAARRWAELHPAADLTARIIAAAAADAATVRPEGAVRKYPEGWLSERRWEDAPAAAPVPAADTRAAHLRELTAERDALRRLHQLAPNDTLAAQLATLDAQLAGRAAAAGGA